jgi:peptide deformylase
MHDLPVELYGASILREKAAAVVAFDRVLADLVQAMFRTMYRAQGQGLAAPQVGKLLRVVVVDLPHEDSPAYALINPRIVERGPLITRAEEGCLSLPGVTCFVERYDEVVVEAQEPSGCPVRIEAVGELAHCVQHELDHLDGILYLDHLSTLQRHLVLKRYEKLSRRKRA